MKINVKVNEKGIFIIRAVDHKHKRRKRSTQPDKKKHTKARLVFARGNYSDVLSGATPKAPAEPSKKGARGIGSEPRMDSPGLGADLTDPRQARLGSVTKTLNSKVTF
jgi:hypothetical protein